MALSRKEIDWSSIATQVSESFGETLGGLNAKQVQAIVEMFKTYISKVHVLRLSGDEEFDMESTLDCGTAVSRHSSDLQVPTGDKETLEPGTTVSEHVPFNESN